MSLSRAKNIFTSAIINSIVIFYPCPQIFGVSPVQGRFVAALLNYSQLSKSQGAFSVARFLVTYLFSYLLYFIRPGVSREGEAFDQSQV